MRRLPCRGTPLFVAAWLIPRDRSNNRGARYTTDFSRLVVCRVGSVSDDGGDFASSCSRLVCLLGPMASALTPTANLGSSRDSASMKPQLGNNSTYPLAQLNHDRFVVGQDFVT